MKSQNEWHVENVSYKTTVLLLDDLLDTLQAIELLQCLVQDLVHSYVFFFRVR